MTVQAGPAGFEEGAIRGDVDGVLSEVGEPMGQVSVPYPVASFETMLISATGLI
jgi:hypothetical protein